MGKIKRKRAAGIPAVLLALTLLLAGCRDGQPDVPQQTDLQSLPEQAKMIDGVVLDASDGQFILRSTDKAEYVFRMMNAEDLTPGGAKPGQLVHVWYDGVLTHTNAGNVKLLRIEPMESVPEGLGRENVAQGTVLQADESSVTIAAQNGNAYRFETGAHGESGLQDGQWVRIVFDGVPESAVVQTVTKLEEEADVYAMTGSVRKINEEDETMEFLSDAGVTYTVSYRGAQILPGAEPAVRGRAEIRYTGRIGQKENDAEGTDGRMQLVQIRTVEPGAVYEICGKVTAAGPRSVDIAAADGRLLHFYTTSKNISGEKAIVPGDSVSIRYTGCIAGEKTNAARVLSVKKTAARPTLLFGTLQKADASQLVLETNDGRTLTLTASAEKPLSGELKAGDSICVRVSGAVIGEDTGGALITFVSYFYS